MSIKTISQENPRKLLFFSLSFFAPRRAMSVSAGNATEPQHYIPPFRQRELWQYNILSRVGVHTTVELFVEGLRNITTAHTIVLPLFSFLLGAPEVVEATEALMTLTAGALGLLAAGTEESPAAPENTLGQSRTLPNCEPTS